MHEASSPVDKGAHGRALAPPDDQIALPMARDRAVGRLGRARLNRPHVRYPVLVRHAATLATPADPSRAQLALAASQEPGEQRPIDRLWTRPHGRVLGIAPGEVTRDLLRRPVLRELVDRHLLERRGVGELRRLGTLAP